jgi:hypothetical protein
MKKLFSFSAFQLFSIYAAQTAICVALVLSLSWNIHQARERTAAVDASFEAGRIDGINWARAVVARVGRMIEEAARQEQEQESSEHIAEEKL